MKRNSLIYCILLIMLFNACTVTDPNNGLKEEFYPNGVIKSQYTLVNGLKDGTAKYFDTKGRLSSITEYKGDLKHGKLINFNSETGKPILEAVFENDIQNGPVIQYYQEGMLFRESTYVNGHLDGIVKTYWPDGKIKAENEYSMSKPAIGLKEYDKNGNLLEQPKLFVKNLGGFNKAIQISIVGEFQNAEFYLSELIDNKYFSFKGRKLRSEDGLAYYNYTTERTKSRISIVVKIKTQYGNTLILQKWAKP